jgi:hypothetical protein
MHGRTLDERATPSSPLRCPGFGSHRAEAIVWAEAIVRTPKQMLPDKGSDEAASG